MDIRKILYHTGYFFGTFFRPLHKSIRYFFLLFKQGMVSSYYKNKLYFMGENARLSPHMWIINPQFISIGDNTEVASFVTLEAPIIDQNEKIPHMEIGKNVSIGEYCHISCGTHVSIGDGVLTGRFVLITDNAHGNNTYEEIEIEPLARKIFSKGGVIIGKNVWIGDKVTILPGVSIGDGCIIAANAVVTNSIPPYSVAAGIPAKVIKCFDNECVINNK